VAATGDHQIGVLSTRSPYIKQEGFNHPMEIPPHGGSSV
jgi:hypothetical protein